MTRVGLLAAVALLAAAPGAARAQASADVFGNFQHLCGATGADRTAALATADHEGWSPVPDALLASFAAQFKNASGRLKSSSSGLAFLVVGEQDRAEAGATLHMRACALAASTADPDAVVAAVQAYAAVPRSDRSTDERAVWAYTDEAGKHAALSLTDAPAVKTALARGTGRVLFEQAGPSPAGMAGRMVVVVLAVPTN